MPNDYELCYSHVTGTASDLYSDYVYGLVRTADFVRLIDLLESNCMDEQADEVKKELYERLEADEEVSDD